MCVCARVCACVGDKRVSVLVTHTSTKEAKKRVKEAGSQKLIDENAFVGRG